MDRERAEAIIIEEVTRAFALQGDAGHAVTPETSIYGPTSDLDSLGFISAVLGVEDALRHEGIALNLNPDGSFDPAVRYATVATMTDYIVSAV